MVFPSVQALRMGGRDNLIADALCDGQLDSIAGSAGVKRAKADKWEAARRLLMNAPADGMTGREIADELGWSLVVWQEFIRDGHKGKIRDIGCFRYAVPYRFFLQGSTG